MTIIDNEFLTNKMGFDINSVKSDAIFKNYYDFTIDAINEVNRFYPDNEDIEFFIENGFLEKHCYIKSPTKNKDERVYLFKKAQAEQLLFDKTNGREALKVKENKILICDETMKIFKRLGLIQPIRY